MTPTIKRSLLFRVSGILIVNFIIIFLFIFQINTYFNNKYLDNTEALILDGLKTKGTTLVFNNSQAIAGFIVDNSFSAINNLVITTINKDQDIIYGIFLNKYKRVMVLEIDQNANEELKEQIKITNVVTKWATALRKPSLKLLKSGVIDNEQADVYEFAAPVYIDKKYLGVIRYGLTTKRIVENINTARIHSKENLMTILKSILTIGMISIFLSYYLTTRFTSAITKPIEELTEAAEIIASGQYDLPINIKSNNEIGRLSMRFDEMRKQVKFNELKLKDLNMNLEDKVKERTKALEKAQKKVVENARAAGKAELAINVLHNIGNALNSVNIMVQQNNEIIIKSKVSALSQVNHLLEKHQEDIGRYISEDPKGKKMFLLIGLLSEKILSEHREMEQNSQRLLKSIRIISDTISSQQKFAKAGNYTENINLATIIQDTVQMQRTMARNENIVIETHFDQDIEFYADRLKFYQILTNLIVNARQILIENDFNNRILKISTQVKKDQVFIKILDNGKGIPKDLRNMIFNHGFTTKKTGSGFGLHSCANYATEMKGKLSVKSDDTKGKSYTEFTIQLPLLKRKQAT